MFSPKSRGQIRLFQTIAFVVLTIILATVLGASLSDSFSNEESDSAGINFSEEPTGEISIQWISKGSANTVIIKSNGENIATLHSVGDSITISEYSEEIEIVAERDGNETVIRTIQTNYY